jgi:AAA domain
MTSTSAAVAFNVMEDNVVLLRQRQDIERIVLTATDELRNNAENTPLQCAAIELAARRLHRYGDAKIEPIDRITETALDCGLDPDEVQTRLGKGLEAGARDRIKTTVPAADWRAELIDPHYLYDQQFPDLRYVVEGLFAEGVNLLASRPKLGESWLLLQIGHAASKGVSTLVPTDNPVFGDVLYLALEDSPRRLRRRLQKFCGTNKEAWPQRLKLVTRWRRLGQGGLDDLREWCRSVEKPVLILIDVLKMVRAPRGRQQSDYDADYESCRGLKELAAEFQGLTIIVAHHDRKMDSDDVFDTVSGTLGLTGGVDAIAVMKRKAGAVTLHIEGRDLPEDIEKAIRFDRDTCRWTILGDATEVQRSSERQRVLTTLSTALEGMSVTEIASAASMTSRGATDKLLFHMLRDGEVSRVRRGIYALHGVAMSKNTGKIGKKGRSALSTLKDQEDKPQSPNLTDLTASLHQSPADGGARSYAEPDDGLGIPEFLQRGPR